MTTAFVVGAFLIVLVVIVDKLRRGQEADAFALWGIAIVGAVVVAVLLTMRLTAGKRR